MIARGETEYGWKCPENTVLLPPPKEDPRKAKPRGIKKQYLRALPADKAGAKGRKEIEKWRNTEPEIE